MRRIPIALLTLACAAAILLAQPPRSSRSPDTSARQSADRLARVCL